jgi:hypothetical protein
MIQGGHIPELYPEVTGRDLFEWCASGRLQPFRRIRSGDNASGRDPKSPKGWRRAFPTEESDRRYDLLCGKYGALIGLLRSARTPEKEQIQADRDRLALSLKKSGRAVELPGIEQLKYYHFRRRQDGAAAIFRLFLEIEELERELAPGSVWKNPCLVFLDVLTLLMDSSFRSADIDEILSSAISPPSPI